MGRKVKYKELPEWSRSCEESLGMAVSIAQAALGPGTCLTLPPGLALLPTYPVLLPRFSLPADPDGAGGFSMDSLLLPELFIPAPPPRCNFPLNFFSPEA